MREFDELGFSKYEKTKLDVADVIDCTDERDE